jgi:hypothetical protein
VEQNRQGTVGEQDPTESEQTSMTEDAPDRETLIAFFARREVAEATCALLRAIDPRYDPTLGVVGGQDAYAVRLSVEQAEPSERLGALLGSAGAARVQQGDLPNAPRPVQPGFTDAAPGIVPEPSDFPDENHEDAGGRFAEQLSDAPDLPGKRD